MPRIVESKQYDEAKKLYTAQKSFINKAIIKRADDLLKSGKPLDSHYAYNMVFSDGIFDPWFDAPGSNAYNEVSGDLGNEDDEVLFISQTWRKVLNDKDSVKYKAITDKILDIETNGL